MDEGLELRIQENIEIVKNRIHQAARRCGRDDSSINLVAITKKKPATTIQVLVDNGITKIGESYLQEAVFKIDLLRSYDIEWHMVGNIQRGKEKHIASHFQVVHSVGNKRTAQELDKYAAALEKKLPVFLELNVSGEDTKQGWVVGDETNIEELLPEFAEILDCNSLQVQGLMTMAPYSMDPENSRPYFRRMRELRDFFATTFPNAGISELSMGMSGDFEVAIEEGATILRIGTSLVGPR